MQKFDYLSTIFIKSLLYKNTFNDFEKLLQLKPSFTLLGEIFKSAKLIDNYLLRYPRPILRRLINQKIIPLDALKKYEDVLTRLELDINFDNCQENDEQSQLPKRYFKVWITAYKYDYELLINEIKESFKTAAADSDNTILISKDQLIIFIEKYKTNESINWHALSREENINWSADLIVKYKQLWDWKYLSEDLSISWSFELLEKIIDKVDRSKVINNPMLKWDIEQIEKFKDFLIFTNIGLKQEFGGVYSGYNYLIEKPKFLKNSLSLSANVEWTDDLIDIFKEQWDWTELSSNENIRWNKKNIDRFSRYVNFNFLSKNKNVDWSEELIDCYADLWNWEYLSGNLNLPWTPDFLLKYEENWTWIPKNNRYFEEKSSSYPSISTNAGIYWDIKLYSIYKDKIDIWRIAAVGKISEELAMKFYEELCRNENIGSKFHKYSDWRATVDLYRTGWENLKLNPNFIITKKNIEYYYFKEIELSYPVGNFANDGYYEKKSFKLLELFSTKTIEGIDLEDLIENEFGWAQYLLNDNFINNSVWEQLIRPILNQVRCLEYLTNLCNIDFHSNDTHSG